MLKQEPERHPILAAMESLSAAVTAAGAAAAGAAAASTGDVAPPIAPVAHALLSICALCSPGAAGNEARTVGGAIGLAELVCSGACRAAQNLYSS